MKAFQMLVDGCKKMDCAKVKNLVRLEFVLYATKKDQVLAKEIGFMCKPVSTIPIGSRGTIGTCFEMESSQCD